MSPRPSAASEDRRPRSPGFAQATADLVADFRERRPLRAGSLLVSVFGDAIAPRGGAVWLGSLIRALEGFGVNQRLVRTSVFRLARDGWLVAEQIGRRSYYSLTSLGGARIEEASQRIYSEPRKDWRGRWTLVLLAGLDAARRDAARKELGWLGFAPFSSSLMAHPAADTRATRKQLESLPGSDALLIMEAAVGDEQGDRLRALVHRAWRLDELAQRYGDFLERFRPVYRGARRARRMDPEQAFQARTLLIHEYRKIVLRDPSLPRALLPPRWPGLDAYALCRELYDGLALPAEDYLSERMETADGPLPVAEPDFFARFGGLSASRDTPAQARR